MIGRIMTAMVAALSVAAIASAQSVSPMKQEVQSATDAFLATLTLRNPYNSPKRYTLRAETMDGDLTDLWLSPRNVSLPAGEQRKIIISAPFGDAQKKEFLICAETLAAQSDTQNIRGEVCARIIATRFSWEL